MLCYVFSGANLNSHAEKHWLMNYLEILQAFAFGINVTYLHIKLMTKKSLQSEISKRKIWSQVIPSSPFYSANYRNGRENCTEIKTP